MRAVVGIIILCVIGALLCILLFTPIRVRASYDQGEASVRVRFGPVALPLYPREASEPKARKPKKEKPPEETAAEGAKNQKKGMKVNREQLLYTLEKLPPVLGRALRRTGRRIRIRPLKLHVLVAGSDPADTAALYGRLEAALAAALPILHRKIHIKDQDVRLFLDFQAERMDCIADVGIAVRLWDLLVIGLCAGASALRWLVGFRRLADKPPAADTDTKKQQTAAREAGAA